MYGTQQNAGKGISTVIADFDFETYSPAGYVWDSTRGKWKCPPGAAKKGLQAVGAQLYTAHLEAEVLCMAYDLKDSFGPRLWTPQSEFPPLDLFLHLKDGKLLEAWNVSFERWVWENICIPQYGWAPLPVAQLRCAMAKAKAHTLPAALKNAGEVLQLTEQKDRAGIKLLERFSVPKDPTKKVEATRFIPTLCPVTCALLNPQAEVQSLLDETQSLYNYCLQDIRTEAEASARIPDLSPTELRVWQADQAINHRGVAVDIEAVKAGIEIIEYMYEKYNAELPGLTGGEVTAASQGARILRWVNREFEHRNAAGGSTDIAILDDDEQESTSLDQESVEKLLARKDISITAKRVLEIRQMLGSASVKKLYSMLNQASATGRLHDLFGYHTARTARWGAHGTQPHNLPNSGPPVWQCVRPYCGYFNGSERNCPCCDYTGTKPVEWGSEAVAQVRNDLTMGTPGFFEWMWPNPIAAISGSLRGMFVAAPGHDLICSDYSAIEAVVLAALAGEEWRMDVFRTHGMIYEMSASKITGIPFQEFIDHKAKTGQHHPKRKTIGKVAELASGYAGWIGAWKQFGADAFFTDEEMKQAILAWRRASPAIVEFWGGQQRGWEENYYGVEGMAILAIKYPGHGFACRGIFFEVQENVLYIRLLSGRYLTYHQPRIAPSDRRAAYQISYSGWNSNPAMGQLGWIRISTYGGRLVENIVQATARDILANALVNLEEARMPVVLHVHDEIVCEIPNRDPDCVLDILERTMSTMPLWAKDWPVKATGGWRGKRYRK